MVTYVFNKLLPLLFNMNTLVSHHSLSLAYTNRFYVGILEDFIVIIQAKAALTLLRMYSCFDTTFPMSELLQQIKQNLGCFIYILEFNNASKNLLIYGRVGDFDQATYIIIIGIIISVLS